MQGIYLITDLVTGDQYVGLSRNIKKRVEQHLSGGSNVHLDKKGKYRTRVLEKVKNTKDLSEKEKHYIKELKPSLNKTKGGELGPGHSRIYPYMYPDRTVEYMTRRKANSLIRKGIYLEQVDW